MKFKNEYVVKDSKYMTMQERMEALISQTKELMNTTIGLVISAQGIDSFLNLSPEELQLLKSAKALKENYEEALLQCAKEYDYFKKQQEEQGRKLDKIMRILERAEAEGKRSKASYKKAYGEGATAREPWA